MLDDTRTKRAAETVDRLDAERIAERGAIEDLAYHPTHEFLAPEEARERDFEPCSVGFTWERDRLTDPDDRRDASGDLLTGEVSEELAVGQNVWFRLRFAIPDSMAGHPVFLRFIARPHGADDAGEPPRVESLCFRDGEPWQAFDNGHTSLKIAEDADGGEQFDLLIEAGTTTLWGNLDVEEFVLQATELYAERPAVADLHRHAAVCTDLAGTFEERSPNRDRLLDAVVAAGHAFPFEADTETAYREGATAALDELTSVEENLSSDLTGQHLTAIGHAHIDLAWLWPWSETVRKGGRSFANALQLMDEHSEFTFMQSQPPLYEWIRNRYPGQHAAIEERIEEGRWQPEGTLWVEADINNTGAESLARQFLLGKRYFREEFDVDPEVTFIPDVFGYSAGLPGIARAADCPYFLTQKMSWNDSNEFPHNTFRWAGIDGSEVLAHFPPVDTYNGKMTTDEVTRSVYNDSQNHTTDDRAYLVGYGDGGGGPTREMVERGDVIDDIQALPDVEWGSLAGLFDRLGEDWGEYPVWSGELYLEKHRGTLTSQADTKNNNRRGEYALTEAELWSSLALARADETVPHDDLADAWKVLLFNQFHDILPGSSVTDVYADADRDYETVFETTDAVREDALAALLGSEADGERLCLTNSLSWDRDPTVAVPASVAPADASGDDLVAVPDSADATNESNHETAARSPVQRTRAGIAEDVPAGEDALLVDGPMVPALGAASLTLEESETPPDNSLDASTEHLENDLLSVTFAPDGTIAVTDRETGREVLDGPGNCLMCYRDHPRQWNAWDIEEDVYAVGEQLPDPETTVLESGPVRATVRHEYAFGDSTLTQDVSVFRDTKRVEFRTAVEWHEEETLLKTHFPAAVETTTATYDTHFGHDERPTHDNTSWDRARFEEAGGQWVDVSETGYGVALLNDSKYGVHVDGTDVSLSLLRAPTHPDPEADRGSHEFTYALYPHEDGPVEAGVSRVADELNAPTRARQIENPVSLSPVSVDPAGVVVEALKRAEDREDELVVRLYESEGRHASATIDLNLPVTAATETNLIEDREDDLQLADGEFELAFEPFEIKTVALELDS